MKERTHLNTVIAATSSQDSRLDKQIKELLADVQILGEGYITFDIRFALYYNELQLKIIINLEAQKSTDVEKLGYHLENRVVFYLSRLISSQKETEFFHSDYDDMKKVYSIWICMDAKLCQKRIAE